MTGCEILAALQKKPMTVAQLWRTTGLPERRVRDHIHRVLRPAGLIRPAGKRSYYTLYELSNG